MYPKLNLPESEVRLKEDKIWDRLRKKWYKLTPEEWVRQHFINYLVDSKNFPEGRLVSEHLVKYNGMNKRCDIALFSDEMQVDVVVECKAPHIELTENTFYQVARYNKVLEASLLILTNGIAHYCAFVDLKNKELKFLAEIPEFKKLQELISN
ncbi:MAG: type I restriction enzyme HsdR N-terminal domain-containing protein [Crocinitomicaceae bacterium]